MLSFLLALFTLICLFLCVYVYVGYPMVLWGLSKLLKNPVQTGNSLPTLSLIIAAYNESAVIGQKIENSLALDYPADKLEIMVVTDGSNDDTAEQARYYADRGVLVLHEPERRGKSAALNRGVGVAQGEWLVFSDANAYYDIGALKALARNFHDARVGCVSGRKTVVKGESAVGDSEGLYWKYESFIKKHESALHSTTGVVGEMTALRRTLFTPIPAHIINDDAYLAFQVLARGYRVLYEPAAFSWERPSVSARDEVVRRQRINAGRYQLLFEGSWLKAPPLVLFMLVSHKFLRLLLPFLMLGLLIGTLALLGTGQAPAWAWALLGAQTAFYVLAALGGLLDAAGMKAKLPKLATFVVTSNWAALQGLLRYLRGKQSVLWEKATRVS
jgi:cellulose synthase/poly-beta-1,6-N-acetylglucosamine synthase-like glycosyltransferase